ncbi:toll/interleukin-1 receptor domain-containing protein [Actinomadura syzygii]|uniref:TIR domain-containing protein n=1 Tax=Actinomadura syzygii TaxID=1427538 RepID=A0A5D0UHB5_9ACTN|nr:toll/interleukin-1 receptor domain-containing protein [Actinomadura syzygii]TYC17424.1 TIR domain-containing protein [Actinomadura syzygii]
MVEAYLAYGRADARWVRKLWRQLHRHGVDAFFDELVLPGDSVIHSLEQALRDTTAGIAVFGPGLADDRWALTEYDALVASCAEKGLPFIPVTFGGAPIPSFARDWAWLDFTDADPDGEKFDHLAAGLADTLRGGGTTADLPERAVLREPPRPLSEPAQRSVVVCYAPADAEYGRSLVERVHEAGLPVWSVRSLRPGDRLVWTTRQQLRHATVVVVVMSPAAQDSEDVTRMILEAQWHERPFFPVLVTGRSHYLLADLWCADAHAGGPLGDAPLAHLVALHEASSRGRPLPEPDLPSAPPPFAARSSAGGSSKGGASEVRSGRVPASFALKRLRAALAEREIEHADLLTTTLLLEAANRLETGVLRRRDAAALSRDLLVGVDELWAAATDGRMGFRVQVGMAPIDGRRHSDFLALSKELGWRVSDDEAVPTYREFAARALDRSGFFPTLRNPRGEQRMDWYDNWTQMALTVHARLRECGVRP